MKPQEKVSWGWAGKQWMKNQFVLYKINFEQWKALWEAQGGRCGGCGEELAHPLERAMKMGLKPETDHVHREGQDCRPEDVRGLLCHRCNELLGKLRDNKDILAGLLEYLRKHGD